MNILLPSLGTRPSSSSLRAYSLDVLLIPGLHAHAHVYYILANTLDHGVSFM